MHDLVFDNAMVICQHHVAQVNLGGATEGYKTVSINMRADGESNIDIHDR